MSIDELIASVGKALGRDEAICEPADGDGDGVSIEELVDGVARAIEGCFTR